MTRTLTLFAWLALSAGLFFAGGDAILDKLETAKTENAKAVDDAKVKLISAIEGRIKAVTDKGDLKAVESLTEVKKAVADEGKLPEGVTDATVRNAGAAR